MGFFSWNCEVCGKSIKSPYDIPEGWEYQNECVVIEKNGTVLMGKYDGYGRIDDTKEVDWAGGEPQVWHKRCWRENGSPMDWNPQVGESESAEDQGFFYAGPGDEGYEEEDWT